MTERNFRPLKVLVIEDEPLIAMLIELSIEQLGHEVVGPFGRLDEAMAAAAADGYNCAIVDVNIAGGPSYPVTDLLTKKQRPFIIASGYADWSLPENLRNQARLTKPYSTERLEAELQLLFDRCVDNPA